MGVIVDGRRTRPVAFDMVMSDDDVVRALCCCCGDGDWDWAIGKSEIGDRPRRFSQQIYKGKGYLSI